MRSAGSKQAAFQRGSMTELLPSPFGEGGVFGIVSATVADATAGSGWCATG